MHNKNIYIYTYICYNQKAFSLSKPIMYWMSSQNSPRILFLFFPFFPCFFVPMFFPNGKWLRKNWCEMDFKTFRRFCGEHGESYITIIKDWRATTMVPAEEKPAMETNDYRKINHDKSTVCCSILQLKVVRNRQANDPIFHNNFPTGETGPTSASEA